MEKAVNSDEEFFSLLSKIPTFWIFINSPYFQKKKKKSQFLFLERSDKCIVLSAANFLSLSSYYFANFELAVS